MRPSLDNVELFVVHAVVSDDEESCRVSRLDETITGWEAWKVRWRLLKAGLGFKLE